jgi:hypothetical protein
VIAFALEDEEHPRIHTRFLPSTPCPLFRVLLPKSPCP